MKPKGYTLTRTERKGRKAATRRRGFYFTNRKAEDLTPIAYAKVKKNKLARAKKSEAKQAVWKPRESK